MNPIRIRKRIESEMLHLPELRDVIGKEVEITIEPQETTADSASRDSAKTPYDKLFELAGNIDLDWDAYRETREISKL